LIQLRRARSPRAARLSGIKGAAQIAAHSAYEACRSNREKFSSFNFSVNRAGHAKTGEDGRFRGAPAPTFGSGG
jgi:hypothetical protein